ncbi:MAG: PAS domain-containing sensor histidine kinase [Deltaproteobacteria bacterium]|nr:PAS domain-containing sensor histidine kinase [Deltaproteobacteria bacterium]
MTQRRERPTSHPEEIQVLHDLQVAEARWQAILGTARDAIVAIDRQARVSLFNPAAEAVFGYRAAEVLGRNVSLLMPPPYRDEHDGYVARYEATGEAHAIGRIRTVEGRRKSGEVFPIELSVSESRVGDEVLYTAILRDVSERRRFEEALRHERDFAERLIETTPLIVLVLDHDGRVIRFNAALTALSGRALPSARGADWLTFVAPRDRERLRILCTGAGNRPQPNLIGALCAADGSERQIAWTSRTLPDASGRPDGVLCIGEDVTERLAAESELRELQRIASERARLADIGAITAKVVHDLGNPLAALSMQAQLILRRARRGDFQPTAPVEAPATQILATLRRLEALIREFNDFTRDQRLDLRAIALAPFLGSCVDLWQPLASEHGIRLVLVEGCPLPTLRADEVMLRRVLDNLIKNAIEAMRDGPGDVVLSTALPAAGRIRITVTDSGQGIPSDFDVFKLFETTKPEGTGLGLAVAKELVHAHGGTIEHAPRPGGGTCFWIELPLDGPRLLADDGPAP